jgi:tRNA modification GTPase
METIYALSSGKLPSGVAIIRISGPQVRFVVETICKKLPDPRKMVISTFIADDGSPIDRGLVCYFHAPYSFTGEDCAEFHCHGSVAVVRALLARLSRFQGLRAADAGEFTKRAFLNGKMDLTSAEGLGDLLSAETEGQRRLAVSQADGGLKTLYDGWRQRLIQLRSMVEAAIDFSEEDDVAVRAMMTVRADTSALMSDISTHIDMYRSTEIIQDGFRVVILGAPNAGKSSLLNALAGREVAIATDEAGTTRDLIDVRMELGGNLVIVTDTAGIRDNAGKVEQIGISRAQKRAASADLVLLTSDANAPVAFETKFEGVDRLNIGLQADKLQVNDNGLVSLAKFDILVSAKSGYGLDALVEAISKRAENSVSTGGLAPGRERQVSLLNLVHSSLSLVHDLSEDDLDLVGELLRRSTDALGRITGRVDVEDLLDVIFSQFCVGK